MYPSVNWRGDERNRESVRESYSRSIQCTLLPVFALSALDAYCVKNDICAPIRIESPSIIPLNRPLYTLHRVNSTTFRFVCVEVCVEFRDTLFPASHLSSHTSLYSVPRIPSYWRPPRRTSAFLAPPFPARAGHARGYSSISC